MTRNDVQRTRIGSLAAAWRSTSALIVGSARRIGVTLRPIGSWLGRIVEAGTRGYPEDTRRRLMILNAIAYLISLSTAGYAVQHALLDYKTYAPLIWINGALILLGPLVPLAHRFGPIAAAVLVVVSEYIALMVITGLLGNTSGVHLQYLVGAAAPFVVMGLERIRLVLAVVVGGLVLHLVAFFGFPPSAAMIAAEPQVLRSIHIQAAITTVGLIAASVWYAFSLVERAKAETERLLRKILPDSVVERLKARPGEVIADAHGEASVLFADISGFVALARSLGPERTVRLLNDIVREFDELARCHGVEKIKTIGDAYMAVAGVPQPAVDHTARLVGMAHWMLKVVERNRAETGIELRLRIGIASGPVMAGVIGTEKFSYDVWGDTVNLASRLEGQAEPGRVLICPRCRQAIADAGYDFEPRGAIEIRGLGAQETWYVTTQTRRDTGAERQQV
ncbi:MAG: adenylate/guanylate cyclase domain-containing protein [Hyphomicrobiaceae bacterium]